MRSSGAAITRSSRSAWSASCSSGAQGKTILCVSHSFETLKSYAAGSGRGAHGIGGVIAAQLRGAGGLYKLWRAFRRTQRRVRAPPELWAVVARSAVHGEGVGHHGTLPFDSIDASLIAAVVRSS